MTKHIDTHHKSPAQVEKDLEKLLRKYKLDTVLDVAKIKSWIFVDSGASPLEASNIFMKKWIKYFQKQISQNLDVANGILHVFQDAWNYFPHQSLGGKSPNEKYIELYGGATPSGSKGNVAPKPEVVVGGVRMSLKQYEMMLKEMEKTQKPFKKWSGIVLVEYQKYLKVEKKFPSKMVREHFEIANIFIERVLHLGFLDFLGIRPAFVAKEFPEWWPTHVMFSNAKPPEVFFSLILFFRFIKQKYGLSHSILGKEDE